MARYKATNSFGILTLKHVTIKDCSFQPSVTDSKKLYFCGEQKIALVFLSVSCFVLTCGCWLMMSTVPTVPQHKIILNTSEIVFITSEEYLSVAIDSSKIREKWVLRNLCSSELQKLTRPLVPAYLRIGGNDADRLIFIPDEPNDWDCKSSKNGQLFEAESGSFCDYGLQCNQNKETLLNMTVKDWKIINSFAKDTGLFLLFDLNVLLRNNNSWDSTNARELLTASTEYACNISWQLGNEPNSFEHVFGIEISAEQLGSDFQTLRALLNEFPSCYGHSALVGPDVTRPKQIQLPSDTYMHSFLKAAKGVINAATFHQYYVNGRTAQLKDFLNPNVLDQLQDEINIMKAAVRTMNKTIPLWLTETSSAWGGGAPGLSDRFVAGFMWLDKLGLAAQQGISLVVRQSLCGGNYSLMDCDKMEPFPDWWLSVLFKKLVGSEVLSVRGIGVGSVRMYAHCTNPDTAQGSVSLFGLNYGNEDVSLDISGIHGPAQAYILTGETGLLSRNVLLNGKKLQLNPDKTLGPLTPVNISLDGKVLFPSFSLGFWVTTMYKAPDCLGQ